MVWFAFVSHQCLKNLPSLLSVLYSYFGINDLIESIIVFVPLLLFFVLTFIHVVHIAFLIPFVFNQG
jgi:hypothetical protein